jgi:hypothetical protein
MNEEQGVSAIIEEFKRGGWIMAVLGGIGMLARLILTNERYSFFIWLRKIIAGGIVGVLAYFAMYGMDMAEIYKSVLCSIFGSLSPEMFEIIRKKVIAKLTQ